MKALILSPHTDDGELGCAGVIASGAFNSIIHYAFSDCDNPAIEDEFIESNKILNIDHYGVLDYQAREFKRDRQIILDNIIAIRNVHRPTHVFIPQRDCHQDHQVIHDEALRAFKSFFKVNILAYDLPWNQIGEQRINYFVELNEYAVKTKIEALSKYESQKDKPYMAPDFTHSLALIRGVQGGVPMAEGFEVVRAYL